MDEGTLDLERTKLPQRPSQIASCKHDCSESSEITNWGDSQQLQQPANSTDFVTLIDTNATSTLRVVINCNLSMI
jgi:hypothetical protein